MMIRPAVFTLAAAIAITPALAGPGAQHSEQTNIHSGQAAGPPTLD